MEFLVSLLSFWAVLVVGFLVLYYVVWPYVIRVNDRVHIAIKAYCKAARGGKYSRYDSIDYPSTGKGDKEREESCYTEHKKNASF